MSSFPPLVQALLQPGAYPEEVASVELAETHISYLFFTPHHVYKVKKPVNFGFLDFTTLEERQRQEGAAASDGRWELFPQQQEEWEPVAEVLSSRYLRLDTEGTVQETMRRLLQAWYEQALA